MASSDDLRRLRIALESSRDGLDRWMIGFTAVVVVGLFIELKAPLLQFVCDQDWRALAASIGSILVAAGVAGELLVEFRAHRKENRLRSINAELELQAEEALKASDVRIAEAERKTAEALLETEKLKADLAWRFLTTDQRTKLVSEISARTGSIWIERLEGDAESAYFAAQFEVAFKRAGWQVGRRSFGGGALVLGNDPSLAPPVGGSISNEFFSFLMEAFKRSGIEFSVLAGEYPPWPTAFTSEPQPPEPAYRLFVGAKLPGNEYKC